MSATDDVLRSLEGARTDKLAAFNARLTPTVDAERFLGVPMAQMRRAAQALRRAGR
ncbi:MAG: hypothetical protein HXK03_05150, partial [Schaalia georgiae]|nr:hypothetical protein [Schaalia georgiae]